MKKPLLVLSLVLLAASLLGATDYYVSNAGSNSNNGTSAASPLLTIAYAQSTHCAPGNRILLHRGDTFAEAINPPCSGSAGHYFQYDSYGISSAVPPTKVMGDGAHSCNIVSRAYIAVQHLDLRTNQCLVQNSTNVVLMYNIIRDVHNDIGVFAAAASTVTLFNNDIVAVDLDGVRGRDINGPSPTINLTNNIIIGNGAGNLNGPAYTGVDVFTYTILNYDHNLISGNGRYVGSCSPYASCDLIGNTYYFYGTITDGGGNLMTSYLPKFISWPHAENAYVFSHDGDSHNQLDMVAEDQIVKQGGGSYTYDGVTQDSQVPAGTYPNIENLKISYPVVAGNILTDPQASAKEAALPFLFGDGVGVAENHTWSHGGLTSTSMFEILSTTNANPTINVDTSLHQITLGTTTPGNTVVFNYAGSCTYGYCMNGDFFAALGGNCTFTSSNAPGAAACTGHGWTPSQDYNGISIQVHSEAKFMTFSGKDVLVDTHGPVALTTPYHAAMNPQNWLESELKDADTWIAQHSGGNASHIKVDINPAGNTSSTVQTYTRDTLLNSSGEPYIGDKCCVSGGNTTIYNFDVMQAGTLAAWTTFNPGGHTDDATIRAAADHMAGFILGGSNFFGSYWHTNCPSGCDLPFHTIVMAMNELVNQGVNVVPFSSYVNTIRTDGHSCSNTSGGYVCTKALVDTGNFHLLPGSPAIDSGATLSSICPAGLTCNIDMDGVDQTQQGTAWEMGAYAYFPTPGVMLTPAPGSTLPGSTVTFTWNAGVGATGYWMDIGNVPGGNQYYQSGNLGNVFTTTVNGLPTNGSTVYVTLYSLIGNQWYSNAYTYTAFNPGSLQGVITSPVPGSTLPGSTVIFNWTAGSGSTSYWLDAGNVPGGNQYYQSGNLGNVLTTTVNGLPTNGSTVYVTLYSLVGGNWLPNSYTYTAFSGGGSQLGIMTSPTPGSTLPGTTVTFNWSAGTSATAYWLDAGNVPGGNQYYQSGNLGNVLTTTATGLPSDGSTVYVTLYSLVGTQWLANAYTYTAFTPGGSQQGIITSPVPGSTLPGSTVTFNWTAGSSSSAYWIDIGNVPGGNQYYQSGNLGNILTVTVNGLPTDGSTVYVTLYSLIGTQWVPNSYTYTAFNPGGNLGVMQTPVPGSTLSGSVATFTWSAGSSATSYWLDIGNVPGGNQYYQSGNLGNVLTTTVYSLPADGSTIYVTLYSYVGSQWLPNAYTYTSGP